MKDDLLLNVAGGIVAAAAICFALVTAYQMRFAATHACVTSHAEHRAEWLQPMIIGKIVSVMIHPAETVSVCDQWIKR